MTAKRVTSADSPSIDSTPPDPHVRPFKTPYAAIEDLALNSSDQRTKLAALQTLVKMGRDDTTELGWRDQEIFVVRVRDDGLVVDSNAPPQLIPDDAIIVWPVADDVDLDGPPPPSDLPPHQADPSAPRPAWKAPANAEPDE